MPQANDSAAPTGDDVLAEVPGSQDVAGESSTPKAEAEKPGGSEEPGKQGEAEPPKKSLYESVKAHLAKQAEGDGSEKSAAEPKASQDEPPADGDGTNETETGEADPPLEPIRNPKSSSDHRFNRLLKIKGQLERDVERFKPAVENFEKLVTFTRENHLSPEDVTEAFEFARLLRNDPAKAYQAMRDKVADMAKQFGDAELPDDLAQDVLDGVIPEERARELARLRARTEHETKTSEERQQREEARRQKDDETSFIRSVTDSVEKYESWWKSHDPDYAKKSKLVQDKVTAMIAGGDVPKSPKDAVEQVKRARKEVEETLAAVGASHRRAPKEEHRTVRSSENSAAPSSLFAAAKAALNKTRAA